MRKREKQYHVVYRKPSGEQLALITQLVEAGEIRPVIDEIVPFADFQQAMDHSEAGHARGKIVVKMQ
ncbi:zinc-binding dehydrogenase [Schleiferilactobacillus harbinensis]|uniref:zinc-binding dehydrogenase n=1 Tax=Schleiferilactobacillus harbinensis TaxID=304207 RepID=UPI00345E899B